MPCCTNMSWTQLQRSYLRQDQLPHESIGALGPTSGLDELPRSTPDERIDSEHPLVLAAHAKAQRQGLPRGWRAHPTQVQCSTVGENRRATETPLRQYYVLPDQHSPSAASCSSPTSASASGTWEHPRLLHCIEELLLELTQAQVETDAQRDRRKRQRDHAAEQRLPLRRPGGGVGELEPLQQTTPRHEPTAKPRQNDPTAGAARTPLPVELLSQAVDREAAAMQALLRRRQPARSSPAASTRKLKLTPTSKMSARHRGTDDA